MWLKVNLYVEFMYSWIKIKLLVVIKYFFMFKDSVDKNINSIPRKENYVLDYPNENDLSDFLHYVKHDDAMAEIYFKNNEVLEDETIQLFKNQGKFIHKSDNKINQRCDLMLVLRDHGKVIGFIELRLTKNSKMMPQLFSLFIDEPYRRKGLANLMMVHALDFFVHSGQKDMTVSPTAESLTVYNKFAFYPPEFDDNGLKNWFEKKEDERLDILQNEPSEFLMMDLRNPSCRETFEFHRKKAVQNFVKFDISPLLKADLQTDVFEWRKKTTTPPSLANNDLGVLRILDDKKKRKADKIEQESFPDQDNNPLNNS